MSHYFETEYAPSVRAQIHENFFRAEILARDHAINTNRLTQYNYSATGGLVLSASQRLEHEEIFNTLNILEKRGTRTITRGPIFFEALDPFLDNTDIINTVIQTLQNVTEMQLTSPEERYVYLDYLKSSILQFFNALMVIQKNHHQLEEYGFTPEIQDVFKNLLSKSIQIFYDFFLFEHGNLKEAQQLADRFVEALTIHQNLFSQLPRENYKLAETVHPLRIAASAALLANDQPTATHIIGVPCGGTEAALVLQYFFQKKQKTVSLNFAPAASFHSGTDPKHIETKLAQQFSTLPTNASVIILDDNTATGNTLHALKSALLGQNISSVSAHAIEADLHRMKLRSQEKRDLPELEMLRYSSGVLAVLRQNHAQGAYRKGSNAINEMGRESLAKHFELRARKDADLHKKIYWKTRAHLAQFPTSRLLRAASQNPHSITVFRDSLFSNFSPAKVTLNNLSFPTTEHAYQYAKNTEFAHQTIGELLLGERDIDWRENFTPYLSQTFQEMCTNPEASPGDVKRIAHLLTPKIPLSHEQRVLIMISVLTQKFLQEPFRTALLATQNSPLIEGTTWGDTFWGIDSFSGEGLNILGRILMILRDEQILNS